MAVHGALQVIGVSRESDPRAGISIPHLTLLRVPPSPYTALLAELALADNMRGQLLSAWGDPHDPMGA